MFYLCHLFHLLPIFCYSYDRDAFVCYLAFEIIPNFFNMVLVFMKCTLWQKRHLPSILEHIDRVNDWHVFYRFLFCVLLPVVICHTVSYLILRWQYSAFLSTHRHSRPIRTIHHILILLVVHILLID